MLSRNTQKQHDVLAFTWEELLLVLTMIRRKNKNNSEDFFFLFFKMELLKVSIQVFVLPGKRSVHLMKVSQ